MTATTRMSRPAADHVDLARTVYDAFNRNDFDRVLSLALTDVEITFVAWDQTVHGQEGFSDFLRGWKSMAPDSIVEVRSQLAGDDGVTNECVFRGTHTGPLLTPDGEVPPTGRSFSVRFCEVMRIRDGRIASLTNYADTLTLLTQLGLSQGTEASST